jgi:uncharacterized protein YkwD
MPKPVARILALVVAVALAFGTAAPSTARPLSNREKKLVIKINNARANHGKAKLQLSLKISNKARNHSKNMAASGNVYHSCLQCKFQGWNWSQLAENVAKARTVAKAHKALMKSSSHRANILGPYKKVGVGVVHRKGWLWVTEIFYR